MKLTHTTLAARALTILSTGLLIGCTSQSALTARPSVETTLETATARYQTMGSTAALIFPRANMPKALQEAESLRIVLGSTAVPLTPASATESMAPLPPTAMLEPDVQGKQRFIFILDRRKSEVVEVQITR